MYYEGSRHYNSILNLKAAAGSRGGYCVACNVGFRNDRGHRCTKKCPFSDALTERIFPDTPPQSSELSHPPPRSYFRILESDTFESLISQFPQVTTASIPQGAYTIGPHYFDPQEIRNAISGQAPTSSIPVFHPNSTHAILVPVKFFNIFFPPPSVSIHEID
ncbi:hypothetical protein ALC56_07177 [Trachymyrmex septentrionalis]|uniref:Uncharacterized protein n=1 Tax=Trachymyrmex septentrionalis TaxID=34720 RepID=A0A151JW20_9HYME|nr:hypothetical protein ALC56_07177 [Trachymyrmex septentrionalis]